MEEELYKMQLHEAMAAVKMSAIRPTVKDLIFSIIQIELEKVTDPDPPNIPACHSFPLNSETHGGLHREDLQDLLKMKGANRLIHWGLSADRYHWEATFESDISNYKDLLTDKVMELF